MGKFMGTKVKDARGIKKHQGVKREREENMLHRTEGSVFVG
jgi:hypothetical protein